MAARPGPTLRRRKLVKKLAEARKAAGMSIRQLAAEMDLQPGTVSKIESGKQGLTVRNIKSIGRVTGLSKAQIDDLVLLAADDENHDDWLVEFRDNMPEWISWFSLYPALEQDAVQIWTYCSELVDGLAQTPAYAEAVTRATFPDISDEFLRRSIDLRKARQRLVDREEPPLLRIVLNEAVVVRPVGGKAVMSEQLEHLVGWSRRPRIELQVLPFDVGAHPGMKTSFTLLRFPEGFDDMDCIYLENENGGIWQERDEDINRYLHVFERLSDISLTPQMTRSLLASLN